MALFIWLLIIVVCCLFIWRASEAFEASSAYLGRNLSEGVKGATINAVGGSMPEFFTTLFFLFVLDDVDGFAGGLGTTAGSAIFNAMIIPAVVLLVVLFSGVAKSIHLSRKVILRDGLVLLFCELVFIMLIGGQRLNWWHGIILMLLYVFYILGMFWMMKKSQGSQKQSVANKNPEKLVSKKEEASSFWRSLTRLDFQNMVLGGKILDAPRAWGLLGLATIILGASCYFLVEACQGVGHEMGVPVFFVAVLLAAAATSLPDTIISVIDGLKGNYDDAISNALGSNIFDICFAMGFPLFLYTLLNGPIEMTPETIDQASELWMFLLFSTVAALVIFLFGEKMGLVKGILLLGIYLIFVIYIIGRADHWPWLDGLGEMLQTWGQMLAI